MKKLLFTALITCMTLIGFSQVKFLSYEQSLLLKGSDNKYQVDASTTIRKEVYITVFKDGLRITSTSGLNLELVYPVLAKKETRNGLFYYGETTSNYLVSIYLPYAPNAGTIGLLWLTPIASGKAYEFVLHRDLTQYE